MGYYTTFKLTITPKRKKIKLLEQNDYLDEDFLKGEGQNWKWYDHEEDMKLLSLNNPNVLFKLQGAGEEEGDLWVKYFKNGKMQVCKSIITYEKYDEKKLK